MSQRRIDPERMQSLQARYEDMSGYLSDDTSFVLDESAGKLSAGTAAVKAVSAEIVTTVDSLDVYLNSIAQAFRDADLNMSSNIEGGMVEYRQSAQEVAANKKMADLAKNQYYNNMP